MTNERKSMFKGIKSIILAVTAAFVLVAVPVTAFADSGVTTDKCLQTGANLDFTTGECTGGGGTDGGTKVTSIIKSVINIASILVAIASVIMIIIGGFKYVTSGGDTNNVGSAKNTILYAIVGLVIVALAQAIVQFVVAKLGSSTQ